MDEATTTSALAAGQRVLRRRGLGADRFVMLQNSNRLTVRYQPADVVVRIAPASKSVVAEREVEVVRRLQEVGAPVAPLDHRCEPVVHKDDEFVVTLWAPCDTVSPAAIAPGEYAAALAQLHEGMLLIDADPAWPVHFTDRVAEAQGLVDDVANTAEIRAADRELISSTLSEASRAVRARTDHEQLVHGEPHRDNVMRTDSGLVFFDFETCCRGPVEFDLAHAIVVDGQPPTEVADLYPGVDAGLVRQCWRLTLALACAWRFEPGDDLPNGGRRALDWVRQLRADNC